MRPRFSRPTVLALAALVLSPLSSLAAEVKIVRVWPEYRSEDSFVRIAEYFGGKESASEIIVRSQPDSRAGYYFLTRFKAAEAIPGAILTIEYFVPGDELARVQFFTVDVEKGSRAILAGLTGSDWAGAKAAPTAWRLRLLGPSGEELARQQSFLWSLPPAQTAATAPDAKPAATATTPAS